MLTKPRYCAQHRHEIPGFEKLGAPIGAIDEWHDWLTFESRNLSRTTKVVGAVVLTAAVVTPAAWAAAPAVGGALGGLTGLSGAAATSHGLAMLGGGSIAAHGLRHGRRHCRRLCRGWWSWWCHWRDGNVCVCKFRSIVPTGEAA